MDFDRIQSSVIEASHPVMSCEAAERHEASLLDTDDAVWSAMERVGRLLGAGILKEFSMSRFRSEGLTVLGLIGKGHNGGDALLGIREMARRNRVGRALVVLACPRTRLRSIRKRPCKRLSPPCLKVVSKSWKLQKKR